MMSRPLTSNVSRGMTAPILRGSQQAGMWPGASLSLNFMEQAYSSGVYGSRPLNRSFGDLITFSRSTTAMRRNPLGLLESVASNQPRFNYDVDTLSTSGTSVVIGAGNKTFSVGRQFVVGETVRATANSSNWMIGKVTAATASSVTINVVRGFSGSGTFSSWTLISALGLLIEEQRTNLCLYSDSILFAPWVGTFGVVETTIPAPDGTFTATRINYAGVSQTYQPITVTPSTQYTFSYYVRLGTKPSNLYAVYDQTNSAFLVAASVNASATASRWTRFSLTFTTPANCTQVRLYPERADNAGTLGTVYLWRVQLEAGAFATSPVGTTSAQVTRAADLPVVGALPPWYRASQGTLVVSGTLINRNSSTKVSVDIGAGGALGTTLFVKHITSFDIANPDVAPVSVASIANNTTLSFKYAMAMRRNDMLLAVNGVLGPADIACEMPASPTKLTLGSGGWTAAGGYLNGHLRSLDYYPRRLPNTDLQTLSAA